jgi:hypothetical protein
MKAICYFKVPDGVLLQKDLGATTTETATAMTEFDPDASWRQAQE